MGYFILSKHVPQIFRSNFSSFLSVFPGEIRKLFEKQKVELRKCVFRIRNIFYIFQLRRLPFSFSFKSSVKPKAELKYSFYKISKIDFANCLE